MNYKLRAAKEIDKPTLYNYKIQTILGFKNMTQSEQQKVSVYINNSLSNFLKSYKLIILDSKIVGTYCSYIKDDYILIDEIFIEEEYRNLGIGTSLLKKQIAAARRAQKNIKLWVYKENGRAIDLYKNLGFFMEEETQTRYLMVKNY